MASARARRSHSITRRNECVASVEASVVDLPGESGKCALGICALNHLPLAIVARWRSSPVAVAHEAFLVAKVSDVM